VDISAGGGLLDFFCVGQDLRAGILLKLHIRRLRCSAATAKPEVSGVFVLAVWANPNHANVTERLSGHVHLRWLDCRSIYSIDEGMGEGKRIHRN